jgi:hypothetical protein
VRTIADLFGMSMDVMCGRPVTLKMDRVHTLTGVADTAVSAAGQLVGIASALKDSIADLSESDERLPRRDALIAACERAYDLAVEAHGVLSIDVGQAARSGIGRKLKR